LIDSRLRGNGDEHAQEKVYSSSKLAVITYPLRQKKHGSLLAVKNSHNLNCIHIPSEQSLKDLP